MKKHILIFALILLSGFSIKAQKSTLEFQLENFNSDDQIKLYFHDGTSYNLDPMAETQTIELNLDQPKRGILYLTKTNSLFLKRRWKEFYIDPGSTTFELKRNRFRKQTKITGSPSNIMFQDYLKGSKKDRLRISEENPNHPFFNSCKKQ